MCERCQSERDRAYALALDWRITETQAVAIMAREHLCDDCAAIALGADKIGRRNAFDGTPWTHL